MIDKVTLTELLLERIYDILWHNELISEDTELEYFKDVLRKDIIYQFEIIVNEIKND